MSSCYTIQAKDPEAYALCRLLRANGRAVTADPGKVYDRAIEVLHREERAFARSGGRYGRPFTRLVAKLTTFRYPGLFNDYNPATKDDDKLLLKIHAENNAILKTVRSRYAHTSPAVQRREFLKELVLDMSCAVRKQLVPSAVREKTALETARGAASDCSEAMRYAFARLRLAGFKPRIVTAQLRRKPTGTADRPSSDEFHALIAVPDPVDPKTLRYIDLTKGGVVIKPYNGRMRPPRTSLSIYNVGAGIRYHKLHGRITAAIKRHRADLARTHIGRIALGIAAFFAEASYAEAKRRFDMAIRYDPLSALAHYNKALLLWSTGHSSPEVRSLTRRALRIMPELEDARNLYSYVD